MLPLKRKIKHPLVAILIPLLVGLLLSITLTRADTSVDFSLDNVKQPKAVLKEGNKVVLEFPLWITNHSEEEHRVSVRLNCVKSTSSATFVMKPGQAKKTYVHPLSKQEVLALNALKKSKKSLPCDFAIVGILDPVTKSIDMSKPADANVSNDTLDFDIYKNRIRVDIKNVRKKPIGK